MLAAHPALRPLTALLLAAALAAAEETLPLADGGTTPLLRLAAEGLVVTVAPELGGKVISLVGPDGVDRLSHSGRPYRRRTVDMEYGAGEFDGLDEVFPTLAASPAGPVLPAIPDHGEAWRLAWHAAEGPGLTLAVDGSLMPYRLTRSITIAPRTLTFSYRLENRGAAELPWTYCFHPLFALGDGLELELPDDQPVQVAVSGGNFLGEGGAVHPWRALRDGPLGGHAAVPGRGRYWKALLATPPAAGVRLHWRDGGVVTMTWSGEGLRHDGIWSTEGAILDGLQHLGVEPCTALEDRLDQAVAAGTAAKLLPGASAVWTIRLAWEAAPCP